VAKYSPSGFYIASAGNHSQLSAAGNFLFQLKPKTITKFNPNNEIKIYLKTELQFFVHLNRNVNFRAKGSYILEDFKIFFVHFRYIMGLWVEFKAVFVLPTITHNYGNYLYGNYVGNAPVGKVIT